MAPGEQVIICLKTSSRSEGAGGLGGATSETDDFFLDRFLQLGSGTGLYSSLNYSPNECDRCNPYLLSEQMFLKTGVKTSFQGSCKLTVFLHIRLVPLAAHLL